MLAKVVALRRGPPFRGGIGYLRCGNKSAAITGNSFVILFVHYQQLNSFQTKLVTRR
jgi:hypothetical protein